MAENAIKSNQGAKQLAVLIQSFLVEESGKNHFNKKEKHSIEKAVYCLEQAFKMKLNDCVIPTLYPPLQEMIESANNPVPVKDRKSAKNYKEKGNEYMQTEMFELAEAEYTSAVAKDPTNAVYYCNRAAARIRLRKFLPAIADCNKALELDRHYAKAYGWLGIAHAMVDSPARAVRCYRKALRIEPHNEAFVANMELISSRMNRIACKVLEPHFGSKRSFDRMSSSAVNKHPVMFLQKKDNKSGDSEVEVKRTNTGKYIIERLD